MNVRQLIEQRIKTEVAAFRVVAGAADLASVLNGQLTSPGCYVFQEKQTPLPSELISNVAQHVEVVFACVIVLRNVRDARGSDAADECQLLSNAVLSALLNWSPNADVDPMESAGGQIVSFVKGFFIWKDTYKTRFFIGV